MNSDILLRELKSSGVDTDTALNRFLGDKELYSECLIDFMDDNSFPALKAALDKAAMREAFAAAHNLKGAAGNLGLTELYKSLCEIVETLRTEKGAPSVIRSQYAVVAEEYDKLNDIIKNQI